MRQTGKKKSKVFVEMSFLPLTLCRMFLSDYCRQIPCNVLVWGRKHSSKKSKNVLKVTYLNLKCAVDGASDHSEVQCHAKLQGEPFSSPQSILFQYLPISLKGSCSNVSVPEQLLFDVSTWDSTWIRIFLRHAHTVYMLFTLIQ